MTNYPRRVIPKAGDISVSDTPIDIEYPTNMKQRKGNKVNSKKTVYTGNTVCSQGANKQ